MQVLELGCGNSQLSEDLYKDGITKITCTDLSAVAVQNMQRRLLSKGLKGVLVDILWNIYVCIVYLSTLTFSCFLPSLFAYRVEGYDEFKLLI